MPRILLRKAAHLGLYGVLGLLCYSALAPPGRRAGLGQALAVLALVVALASAGEWHQRFVPGRIR